MRVVFCGRWNRHSSTYPETKELWRVREAVDHGRASAQDLRQAQDAVTALLLSQLERLGLDTLSDGGFRWDSLYDIARRIGGCSGFSRLIRIPETNHFHRQPVATLPLRWEGPILLEDLSFARAHTRLPVALTLPGPYSLARQTENYRAVGLERLAEAYAAVLTDGLDRSRIGLSTWFADVTVFPDYFALPFGLFFLNLTGNGQGVGAVRDVPADQVLALGIVDANQTYAEQPEDLSERVRPVASQRPAASLMVTSNADFTYLPWDRALEKLGALVGWAQSGQGEERR